VEKRPPAEFFLPFRRQPVLLRTMIRWKLPPWIRRLSFALPRPFRATVDYVRDVKPILAQNCYRFHAARSRSPACGSTTAASLREGGDTGPASSPASRWPITSSSRRSPARVT